MSTDRDLDRVIRDGVVSTNVTRFSSCLGSSIVTFLLLLEGTAVKDADFLVAWVVYRLFLIEMLDISFVRSVFHLRGGNGSSSMDKCWEDEDRVLCECVDSVSTITDALGSVVDAAFVHLVAEPIGGTADVDADFLPDPFGVAATVFFDMEVLTAKERTRTQRVISCYTIYRCIVFLPLSAADFVFFCSGTSSS